MEAARDAGWSAGWMRMGLAASVALLVASMGAVGCGTGGEPAEGAPGGGGAERGMRVGAAALKSAGVDRMRMTVSKCSGGQVEAESRPLEQMTLPGGLEGLEEKPFAGSSRHHFSDAYFLLDAGCYDVRVEPLDASGGPSGDCDPARQDGVRVKDGETTEILLISQCKGPEKGGLDVVGSLNHPPRIENVTYHPSKFVQCRQRAEICALVSDPDDDPLTGGWSVRGAGGPIENRQVDCRTRCRQRCSGSSGQCQSRCDRRCGDGATYFCGTVRPARDLTKLTFEVYDQLWVGTEDDDPSNDRKITVHEYFRQQGRSETSRDTLKSPLYANCPGGDVGGGAGKVGGGDVGRIDVGNGHVGGGGGIDVGVSVDVGGVDAGGGGVETGSEGVENGGRDGGRDGGQDEWARVDPPEFGDTGHAPQPGEGRDTTIGDHPALGEGAQPGAGGDSGGSDANDSGESGGESARSPEESERRFRPEHPGVPESGCSCQVASQGHSVPLIAFLLFMSLVGLKWHLRRAHGRPETG